MSKQYVLKCYKCNKRNYVASEAEADKQFIPYKNGCKHCRGKQYKCPSCGFLITLREVRELPLPKDHIHKELNDQHQR